MRRLLVLAGLCMAIGCAPSDSGSPAEPDNSTAQVETNLINDVAVETKSVSFEVDGMVCGVGCVAKVKETLSTLPVSLKRGVEWLPAITTNGTPASVILRICSMANDMARLLGRTESNKSPA